MNDRIYIRDLALRCIIGIYPEERENKQDVIINVVMEVESHATAAASDDIADATDYKNIKKKLVALIEASEFNLIETMAERCAEVCLAPDRVYQVTVTVDKPGALRFARSVAVEVTRRSPQTCC